MSVDWEKPLPKYILECCINCGAITRTKNKEKLTLFLMDHYGKDGIRLCKNRWFGRLVFNIINWKYRKY